MSEDNAGGSSLLTEGVGTPQGGPEGQAAPDAANQAAAPAFDWKTHIPEDLRKEPVFSKYDTFEGLAKSHVNLEKLLGGEKIPKPKDDDDAEGWDRYYRAGGRPDKADEYEFEKPNSLPENFYEEEAEKSFKTWAHQNGLSKRQASNLHKQYVTTQLERHQAYQKSLTEARSKAEGDLKREWGSNYEAKINAAKAALNAYADPDYIKFLDESGLGNTPQMTRAWARIGEKMVGEKRLAGTPTIDSGVDIKTQISEYRTKYAEALHTKTHPDHELRVKGMSALYDKAYGT